MILLRLPDILIRMEAFLGTEGDFPNEMAKVQRTQQCTAKMQEYF